jgi:hypothetical protein
MISTSGAEGMPARSSPRFSLSFREGMMMEMAKGGQKAAGFLGVG